MIRRPISPTWRIGLGIVSVVALILGYQVLRWANPDAKALTSLTSYGQKPEDDRSIQSGLAKILSPQVKAGQTSDFKFWENPFAWAFGRHLSGWLFEDAWHTFYRHFVGLALSVVLSVVIGLAIGVYAPLEALFGPVLAFLAKIPPTAVLAVFFALFGVAEKYYIATIVFGVLPLLSQTVYQAVKHDVPDELLHKAYTLGASHLEVIWNVIFKIIFPRIIEAVRLQVGPALVYLIAAESLSGDVGFGYRLKLQFRTQHYGVMYCYVAILGLSGFMMDICLTQLRRWLCPWSEKRG